MDLKDMSGPNGVTYTNKELIHGIHKKLDGIAERLAKGETRFATLENNQKWHFRAISGLYVIIGGFLVKPVRSFFKFLSGGF